MCKGIERLGPVLKVCSAIKITAVSINKLFSNNNDDYEISQIGSYYSGCRLSWREDFATIVRLFLWQWHDAIKGSVTLHLCDTSATGGLTIKYCLIIIIFLYLFYCYLVARTATADSSRRFFRLDQHNDFTTLLKSSIHMVCEHSNSWCMVILPIPWASTPISPTSSVTSPQPQPYLLQGNMTFDQLKRLKIMFWHWCCYLIIDTFLRNRGTGCGASWCLAKYFSSFLAVNAHHDHLQQRTS